MAAKQKFKSDLSEAIHSSASAMYRVGAIDQATMREFDESCLTVPAALAPARIKRIRKSQRVSQPVFARYLNTSESTVEKWESGREEAQRHGAQAAERRGEARAESAGVMGTAPEKTLAHRAGLRWVSKRADR